MRFAAAFAPAHITGFFVPQPHPQSILAGSLGAGINLDLGITSRVWAKSGGGQLDWTDSCEPRSVSEEVARQLLVLAANWDLELAQDQVFPAGFGLGSSGAGALSLALAANAALGFPLSPLEAAQLAHRVEVQHRTGLGTVLAQTVGGLEIRTQAGAPGLGRARSLPVADPVWVHLAVWDRIDTREALGSLENQQGLMDVGAQCLQNLHHEPDWRNFMRQSHQFTSFLNLTSEPVRRFGAILEARGHLWAMPLFGQGLFWLSEQEDHESLESLGQFNPAPVFVWRGRLRTEGACLV